MNGLFKEGSLGAILFNSQIITEQDIRAALAEQEKTGCRFGEALVKLGIVTQEDIDWALSSQLNIPYVRLKREMIDRGAAELVPATTARQYNLMPLLRVGDELTVAMADPLNKAAVEAVEQLTGCRVTVSVALIREIREMQEFCYGPAAAATLGFAAECFPPRVLEEINADLSGGRLLDYLLVFIVQNKLTSLSLQPLGEAVAIAAKRAGVTREIGRLAATYYPDLMLRLRKLSRINGSTDCTARGTLGLRYKGTRLSFQVLLLRGVGGDYVTLRMQPAAMLPARVAELGVGTDKVAAFRALASVRQGLVLFVQRDGDERCRLMDLYLEECDTAGKSVLLLGSGLGRAAKRFSRIAQPGGPHGEPQAMLTAALEHDPDIIAVEDVTDSQAFIAAAKAAMRGKLVLAGVSFDNTAAAFKQLLYLWHRHYFIPTCLKGIVASKGVAVLCPHCREAYAPAPEEVVALGLASPPPGYCRAPGCRACDQTGHHGRRYLLDVISLDAGLLEVFEKARDSREVERYLQEKGYRGILAEGNDLLQRGEVSPAEYVASVLL